jgi:hypothetical protein
MQSQHYLAHSGFAIRFVQVHNSDRGSGFCQQFRRGATDAARPAGHNLLLSFQFIGFHR